MNRFTWLLFAFGVSSIPTALALSRPLTPRTTTTTSAATNSIRNCADYASYWEELLLTEYREASNELKERRRTWSRRQLEDAGICVFGAAAVVRAFVETLRYPCPSRDLASTQRLTCFRRFVLNQTTA
eukprot:scaffold353_cov185-Amphora_coffeaeformis.AAC.54